jgi:hypothetical protein
MHNYDDEDNSYPHIDNVEHTGRGFEIMKFRDCYGLECSLQESSAMGPYEDSYDRPGSSYVWLGVRGEQKRMHLNRGQAYELAERLLNWVNKGTFEI